MKQGKKFFLPVSVLSQEGKIRGFYVLILIDFQIDL